MTNHINFRTATTHGTPETAPRVPQVDPPRAAETGSGSQPPRRSTRRWIVPIGLAVAATGAAAVLLVQHGTDTIPTNDSPAEVRDVGRDSDAERPGDLSVSGWYTKRTYDVAPSVETAVVESSTDAERPGDLSVSGWYTTRNQYVGIENTAAPALRPAMIGEPVVLPGTVSCIPFQALGPNVDLAPDPNGQRSSGVEVLADLRPRGPNADLPFDATGQRSSGADPVCAAL